MSPRKYDMSRRAAATEATRQRILDATRELHSEQGIGGTSWEDIAQRAGVGVGTVYRHFPSLDELVPACGEVSMQVVALPDPTAAPALFEGVRAPAERIERLVAEAYAIYERGASDIAPMIREPDVHPAVREAAAYMETSLGALVDAALRPLRPRAEDRRVARAMIDFGTWKALRDQGLSARAAVGAAAQMLAARLVRH
jgi:AcrR family transcriptional regulator